MKKLILYPVNPTHTHPKGLYRASDEQQFMLMHFSNGSIAITPERLDEVTKTAEVHGVEVETSTKPLPAPRWKEEDRLMIVINQVAAERIVQLLEQMVALNDTTSRCFFRWKHNSTELRNDAADLLQYIREGQPDPCNRIHIEPKCSR